MELPCCRYNLRHEESGHMVSYITKHSLIKLGGRHVKILLIDRETKGKTH